MKHYSNKKGVSLKPAIVINILIGLVIVFNVLALIIPEVNTAGESLFNDTSTPNGTLTGTPFSSFFRTNGLMVLAIMAATVIIVVRSLQKGGR